MAGFRPARPLAGRLVRLGLVLDARNTPDRLCEIARMADGAGLDALWAADSPRPADLPRASRALEVVALVAPQVGRVRLGAMLRTPAPPTAVARAVARLAAALGDRLEIGLAPGRAGARRAQPADRSRLVEYAATLRALASPAGGGPAVSIELAATSDATVAARIADNVVIPAAGLARLDDAVDLLRRECEAAGRPPASLGIAVELPVSIGRTMAEARARADAESVFEVLGHPAEVGIFGTLEQGQDRVIALAHRGVTDLRCVLPNSADVADVIAQLTAIAVGTVDALRPHSPRSRPPDPPPWARGR